MYGYKFMYPPITHSHFHLVLHLFIFVRIYEQYPKQLHGSNCFVLKFIQLSKNNSADLYRTEPTFKQTKLLAREGASFGTGRLSTHI